MLIEVTSVASPWACSTAALGHATQQHLGTQHVTPNTLPPLDSLIPLALWIFWYSRHVRRPSSSWLTETLVFSTHETGSIIPLIHWWRSSYVQPKGRQRETTSVGLVLDFRQIMWVLVSSNIWDLYTRQVLVSRRIYELCIPGGINTNEI